MLRGALERALRGGEREAAVAQRLRLIQSDARDLPREQLAEVDVIYLDPMFMHPRRAAPGKAMQLLAQLLDTAGSEDDSPTLLAWARCQPVQRVVVKRPRRAAPVAGPPPGHSLQGRAVRFDVYPLSQPRAAADTEKHESKEE